MRQAIHQHLIVTFAISFGLMTAYLSLLQPIPFASAQQLTRPVSQETDRAGTQVRRIENLDPTRPYPTKSLEKKDAQTSTRKPHRLIRTPQNAPVASVEPFPSGSSPVNSVPTLPPSLQSDNTTSQSKEPSTLNRSVGAAVPLSTMSVAPSSTTTARSLAAGAVSTGTIPLAAAGAGNSSTSGSGSAGGRSMSRLAAEMPGLAQLISPPSLSVAPPPPSTPIPTIGLNSTALSFSAVQNGAAPASQSVTITNAGTGTLTWTASSNMAWLKVNGAASASGTNTGILAVTVSPTGLAPGSQTGLITLTASGATNTPQSLPVTFAITAAPNISLSPSSLTYAATQGAANPANQTVSLTTSGGTLNWTVTGDATWLTVSPALGNSSSTLTASVNTIGLTAGPYTGTITVAASGATSRTVSVTLTVNAPATSSVILEWTANTEPDLGSYNIYRSTVPGVYGAALATVQKPATTYMATGLNIGTTYYFTVTAVDSAGNESLHSNEVSKSIF